MDIIVTFDLDNIGCNGPAYEINNVSFDYPLDGLYDYLARSNIRDFTAFPRIDCQVRDVFGDYLYVLKKLPPTPDVGWHIHPYVKSDRYYHTKDQGVVIRELWEVYNSNPAVRGMKSVRIGGAFMTNEVMATLNSMHFQVDSTCMPACSRDDGTRWYDWSHSGNNPYRPGITDYQCAGQPCYNILEVPMTTMPIPAPYDRRQVRRYINPVIRKEIFQPAFSTFCDILPHIVVVFHPDQLVDGYEDAMYKYGMDNFMSNMDHIISSFDSVTFKSLSSVGG